ncbi:MAG: hypothetical protein JXA94_05325 [Parachlamydiales bacterium]|nr:hypothetical protein [Parachlamydiales bacterium]
MNYLRVIISGIVIWLVNMILIFLTCGWLFKWVYMLPPNLFKAPEEMMIVSNIVGSNLIGLIKGLLFAYVFAVIYKGVPGTRGVHKGIVYGILIWLVSALPSLAGMPFFMVISNGIIIYWIVQALVFMIISGAILGAIYKPHTRKAK